MKRGYFLFLILLCLFQFSCGKFVDHFKNTKVNLNLINKSKNEILTDYETPLKILQGYNRMVKKVSESCVVGEIENPKAVISSSIRSVENLSYQNILNVLKTDASFAATVETSQLSSAVNFASQAAAQELSWTVTHIVEVYPGEIRLSNTKPLHILPALSKPFFNDSGRLIDTYRFIQKCGTDLIVSQKLASKLLITMKLTFESKSVQKSFEQNIGGSVQNIFSDADSKDFSLLSSTNVLRKKDRKQVNLSIYGFQLGGSPTNLLNILGSKTSCRLDNLERCQDIFNKLKLYISKEYKSQLDIKNLNSWIVESSIAVPYTELKIFDQDFTLLDLSLNESPEKNIMLLKMSNVISSEYAKQLSHYSQANAFCSVEHITSHDRCIFKNIANKAKNNLQMLEELSNLTYAYLDKPYSEFEKEFHNSMEEYDPSPLLQDPSGVRLAGVRSKSSVRAWKMWRSSDDIAHFSIFFDKGSSSQPNFTSFEVLFKSDDGNLLDIPSASIDLYCNTGYALDLPIFRDIRSGDRIMLSALNARLGYCCSLKSGFYVANPKNFADLSHFNVEIIGKY